MTNTNIPYLTSVGKYTHCTHIITVKKWTHPQIHKSFLSIL